MFPIFVCFAIEAHTQSQFYIRWCRYIFRKSTNFQHISVKLNRTAYRAKDHPHNFPGIHECGENNYRKLSSPIAREIKLIIVTTLGPPLNQFVVVFVDDARG